MPRRYDLVVIDRDQRVRLVADCDLSRSQAEARIALYEPPLDTELVMEMAKAGTYCVGEDFEYRWHEEEE